MQNSRHPETAPASDHNLGAGEPNQVQTQFGLRTNGRTSTVPATRWPVYLLVGIGATVVAAVVLPMFTPLPMIGIGIAGAALTALAVVGQIQAQGRATVTAEAKIALERVTGPLGIFRPSRWRGGFVGIPDMLSVKYHPGAVVADLSWPAPAAAAVSQIFGERYRVAKINKRSGRMKLSRDRSAAAAEQPKSPEVERASGLMTQIFGPSTNTKIGLDDEGRLARVEVVHDQKLKASVTAWRDRVDRVVTTMLAGRWRSFWDMENDRVVFELRPKMPRSIVREPLTAADQDGPAFYKVKIGLDEDSHRVLWDLMSSAPHCLLAGKTGKGKTNVIRGIAIDLAARGIPVMCGDPKRIELRGLRDWPNVQLVTTSIESIVAMIIHAWRVMEDRYAQIENGEARVTDFELMVVIVDEYSELSTRITAWWSRVKRPGQPSRCPIFEQFDSLVRLGRKAGIRVVVGMQRPDVKFFGETGEARDNFDARISVGRMERDGSRMMWNSMIGTTLPGIPGRALASTDPDSGVREMQVYYTPDPSEPASEDELKILDSLRPAVAKWPQLELTIPEPEVDDKGRPMVWESLEASTLEPVEQQDQDTDTIAPAREQEKPHLEESSSSVSGAADDDLLEMAAGLVVNLQLASAAMLIRKLRIRHAEALTLLNQLQEYGIVEVTDDDDDVTVCYQPDDLPAALHALRTQRAPTAETAPGSGQEPAARGGGEVINFPAATRKQPQKANQQKSTSDTGTKVSDDPITDDLINTDGTADIDGVESGGEEYGTPQPVAACDVQAGDLVLLDDQWVVVEACEPDELEPGQHVIDWRSADDDDDYGALLKPSSEPVMSRQPNDS